MKNNRQHETVNYFCLVYTLHHYYNSIFMTDYGEAIYIIHDPHTDNIGSSRTKYDILLFLSL